jgi:GNAT superfamily N-acetyltransferase
MINLSKTHHVKDKSIHIINKRISSEEYINFLKRTDLGSQYPKENFIRRIRSLVNNVSISLIAYDRDRIIGICFGLTDFAYWLFISDLGIDRDYYRMGIGQVLLKEAQKLSGGIKNIIMFTTSNKKAVGFYKKCGWKPTDFVMYNRIKWTKFTVT